MCDGAPTVLPKYGITTTLRKTHFFAPLEHEAASSTSAARRRIAARKPGATHRRGRWQAGARDCSTSINGNRMGNGPPSSGDGYRYRGLAQITGKDGYAAMQKITGFPLVKHPEQVFDRDKMLKVAAGVAFC